MSKSMFLKSLFSLTSIFVLIWYGFLRWDFVPKEAWNGTAYDSHTTIVAWIVTYFAMGAVFCYDRLVKQTFHTLLAAYVCAMHIWWLGLDVYWWGRSESALGGFEFVVDFCAIFSSLYFYLTTKVEWE